MKHDMGKLVTIHFLPPQGNTTGAQAVIRLTSFLFVLWVLLLSNLSVDGQSSIANAQNQQQEYASFMKTDNDFLIDDFASGSGIFRIGTSWRRFTDQVMGGRSHAEHEFITLDGRNCLLLRGEVSLANNGGFIQVDLPLDSAGKPFDASNYDGVRLWVKGEGAGYYVHLRSEDTRLPWQYYQAPLECHDQWQAITISFRNFRPQALNTVLDPSRLTRVAVVAAKQEFSAEVAVSRLELYSSSSAEQ